LKNLTNIHLVDNFLSCELPEQLFNLTRLVKLEIFHNELTGTLPAKIGNLANLETSLLRELCQWSDSINDW